MNFRLLEDRIAVLADPVEEKTKTGLIVPESGQSVLRYGTVKSVGVGHRSEYTGKVTPIDVKEGDRVFFHKSSGQPLEIDEVEYIILSPREIVGTVS